MSRVTVGSSTTNLSRTDRPVWTPVSTISEPSIDSLPSRRRNASATKDGAVRLECTGRPACTPVPASAEAAWCGDWWDASFNCPFPVVKPGRWPAVQTLFRPRNPLASHVRDAFGVARRHQITASGIAGIAIWRPDCDLDDKQHSGRFCGDIVALDAGGRLARGQVCQSLSVAILELPDR